MDRLVRSELKREYDKYEILRRRLEPPKFDMNLYFPAVSKIWMELKKVKSGSGPSEKMENVLYEARLEVSYRLNCLSDTDWGEV